MLAQIQRKKIGVKTIAAVGMVGATALVSPLAAGILAVVGVIAWTGTNCWQKRCVIDEGIEGSIVEKVQQVQEKQGIGRAAENPEDFRSTEWMRLTEVAQRAPQVFRPEDSQGPLSEADKQRAAVIQEILTAAGPCERIMLKKKTEASTNSELEVFRVVVQTGILRIQCYWESHEIDAFVKLVQHLAEMPEDRRASIIEFSSIVVQKLINNRCYGFVEAVLGMIRQSCELNESELVLLIKFVKTDVFISCFWITKDAWTLIEIANQFENNTDEKQKKSSVFANIFRAVVIPCQKQSR